LVLATGFDIWTTNFPAIEIIGRDGRNLGKWWRENRFQAYEGVAVPYFPNYITLSSPYSYSGLSYFTTIESQMRHLKRLFGELRRRGATTFEVSEQANAEFLDRMRSRLGDSVFNLGSCSSARSYYFNQHGEAAILRPTSTINAFREADRFPLEDYAYA
ncbi:MAG: NAD(P)/FAD-dependent oxidoreductase, partial [Jatrophihabitans sp.]